MRARLVELDERNVALARQAAQAAGLHGVEVLQADAGVTDACAGAVPAQIVVACGIFGNITGSDIQATVAALPSLCAPGALVLWTRHRRPPDLTPAIRSWFGEAGFREEAFDTSHDGFMSVGAHRLAGEPAALALGQRLFTFVGGTSWARETSVLAPARPAPRRRVNSAIKVLLGSRHGVILEQAERMPGRVDHDPDVVLRLDGGRSRAGGKAQRTG